MKAIKLAAFFLLISTLLFVRSVLHKNQTYYYEPAHSELIGTIKMLTFPGRPNYEDINNGDEPEKCPYLILDHYINVKTSPTTPVDSQLPFDEENKVSLIQLAVGEEQHWKWMKNGMRLRVNGELYGAISGHHHTRVLMSVSGVELISKQVSANFNKIKIVCNPDHLCETVL